MSKILRITLITFTAIFILTSIGVLGIVYTLTHRVQGEYVNSNGVRIHYTIEGKGDPVILLHGFAVNADLNWRLPGITQALAKEYRVISMDLRGHGLSDKPHALNAYGSEMAKDVLRLLDHLQIEKTHIVGYSLGGFITLYLISKNPHRFISAGILGAGWEPPGNSTFLSALSRMEKALRSGKSIEPLSGHLGPERKKPGVLHTLWVKLMTGYFNDPQALSGVIRGVPDLMLQEDAVRKISTPIGCIVGSTDPLRVSAEAMVDRIPGTTFVVIQGADHMATPGRGETIDALRRFLDEHRL